jgi:hypothetical protein
MPLIKDPVILPENELPGFYIPQAGSSFQHKRWRGRNTLRRLLNEPKNSSNEKRVLK